MTPNAGDARESTAGAIHFNLEDLCVEFETAWRADLGQGVMIEDLLARVAEPQRAALVEELVATECELRAAHGSQPNREEYAARFPNWTDAVDAALRWWQATTAARLNQEDKPLERLGDYRIEREIGRGGMGIVYEAVQESLGRRVAIKTLVVHPLCQSRMIARFRRETYAVAALHHTNIVEVYGAGTHNGIHYYAMQLVEGTSLSQIIAAQTERTKRDHLQAARIGLQVAQALQYAHGHGILHRDIKPSNLLLDARGIVRVMDFGLAKLRQSEDDATRSGEVVGTLRYLPPESIHGQWDERGDVYSLGVTLYELITGRPALDGAHSTAILHQLTKREIPPIQQIDASVPRDLDTIVMKAIARNPAERYVSAGALADDLQRLLEGKPIVARRAKLPERIWKWSRREPALAVLLALIAFVAVVGFPMATMLWWRAEVARADASLQRSKAETANDEAQLAREDAEAVGYATSMQLAQYYVERRVPSEAATLLQRWTPSESASATANETPRLPDRRDWEWQYLHQLLDVSEMQLPGHGGAVLHVAIRPDNAQIATVVKEVPNSQGDAAQRAVFLWNRRTGQRQHMLRDDAGLLQAVAYSPDSTRLATLSVKPAQQAAGSRGHIMLWDCRRAALLTTIELSGWARGVMSLSQHKPAAPGLAFSQNGRWLLSWPDPVEILQTETSESIWQTDGCAAALLPDGEHVAVVGREKQMLIHHLATGRQVQSIPLGNADPVDFACSADGTILSAMIAGNQMRLWQLPDYQEVQDLSTPDIRWGSINSAGDQLIYSDRRGLLHFQPLDPRQEPDARMGHTNTVWNGAISRDGRWLVTASSDGTARVWDLAKRNGPLVIETELLYDRISDIAFDAHGGRVLYAANAEGAGWQDEDGERFHRADLQVTEYTHAPRTDFAFSPDGRRLAAPAGLADNIKRPHGYARSGAINIWSTERFELLNTVQIGAAEITSVAWSRDGAFLAVATYDDQQSHVAVCGAEAGREPTQQFRFPLDTHPIRAMSFNTAASQLAVATNDSVSIWRASPSSAGENSQRRLFSFANESPAAFVDYSPTQSRLAAAFPEERRVRVYDTLAGTLLYEADAPKSACCVRFSPNGRRLAMVGFDSLVHFCDAETGHRLLTLDGGKSAAGTINLTARVAFSPDGRRIAANDWQGRITVWHADASVVR